MDESLCFTGQTCLKCHEELVMSRAQPGLRDFICGNSSHNRYGDCGGKKLRLTSKGPSVHSMDT